jgi:hypothetical protein
MVISSIAGPAGAGLEDPASIRDRDRADDGIAGCGSDANGRGDRRPKAPVSAT